MVQEKRVFRPNELRVTYGITRDLAFKLISTGELRSFVVGRSRFITAEAIEEFIRQREEAAN